MKRWWDRPSVELACRLLVGGVFVIAGSEKILHVEEFAKIVDNYRLLPVPASNFLAMSLPWMELVAGLALIVGTLKAEAALLLSGLLSVFIVALSVNLARGVDIECGCLSVSGGGRSIGLLTVLEDLVLLAAVLIVLYRARPSRRVT